jgi:hypothetical protein
MRVLCVGRHAFLSEHLCRVFGAAGAHCEPVVGMNAVSQAAARFEPQVVICEGDLLTSTVLESWARERSLTDVPVIAVTLTPPPDDKIPAELPGTDAAAIYLPSLNRLQVAALLDSARTPRGVSAPLQWRLHDESASASAHHR